MLLKDIPLKDLQVNNANDRHGELVNPDAATSWLLQHRADHMRNLSKDIANSGGIYEPPLVHAENGEFTIYDGNRRVTCLKLLSNPTHAPTDSWRKFYTDLRGDWPGTFPSSIQCQIEVDKDRIDEILYRRHTGGQGGIGQSPWDASAKSNFVGRTGKKSKVNVGEEIENKLKVEGYLDSETKVPRSNLIRLLSSEGFRNRVGITVQKNHVEVTHDETKVMHALQRIVNDLVSKEITLDDIWSNQDKKEYLDILETEGVLPTATDSLTIKKSLKTLKPVTPKPSSSPPTSSPTPQPKKRKTLIRNDIDYGVLPQAHTQRAMDVWTELQHNLDFSKHSNAISVLFRVLLEFSVENYIAQNPVSNVHAGDKLAKKFSKVLDHMLGAGVIDKKYHEGLKKFEQTEAVLSANTMNKYVHHKNFFPSDHHLQSMWDTLSDFIVICLKA